MFRIKYLSGNRRGCLFTIAGIFFFCFLLTLKYKVSNNQTRLFESTVETIPSRDDRSNNTDTLGRKDWIKHLQDRNGDIVGWLCIEGTKINEPILQAADNQKYLTVGYDGKKNPAGAIFLDYECDSDFFFHLANVCNSSSMP